MKKGLPIFPVVVALAVVLHLMMYVSSLLRHSYLANDSIQYLTLADNLAQSGIWSQSYVAPFAPDAQRTPGYPVLMVLMGRLPWLILLFQHAAILGAAYFLFLIAKKTFSASVAKWVTGIWLLQPYPILLSSVLLSESFFIFFLMVTLHLFLKWKDERKIIYLMGGISSLVAAAFIRPVAYPLLILAILFLLWMIFRQKQKMLPQMVIVILIPLLSVGGWILRNHAVTGRYTFNTMGDMGMIHGRLGGIEAVRKGEAWDEHHLFMAGDSIMAMERGLANVRASYSTIQNHETELFRGGLTVYTLKFFLRHPTEAVVFHTRAVGQMLTGTGFGWCLMITGLRPFSLFFAGWQVLLNLFMYFGFLLAFWRATKWPLALRMSVVAALLMLLVSAVAWSDGRYRMVCDPAFVLCIGWVLQRRMEKRAKEKLHPVEDE